MVKLFFFHGSFEDVARRVQKFSKPTFKLNFFSKIGEKVLFLKQLSTSIFSLSALEEIMRKNK